MQNIPNKYRLSIGYSLYYRNEVIKPYRYITIHKKGLLELSHYAQESI